MRILFVNSEFAGEICFRHFAVRGVNREDESDDRVEFPVMVFISQPAAILMELNAPLKPIVDHFWDVVLPFAEHNAQYFHPRQLDFLAGSFDDFTSGLPGFHHQN